MRQKADIINIRPSIKIDTYTYQTSRSVPAAVASLMLYPYQNYFISPRKQLEPRGVLGFWGFGVLLGNFQIL